MLDIHSLQTIGYFDIPVDHIYGETAGGHLGYLTLHHPSTLQLAAT